MFRLSRTTRIQLRIVALMAAALPIVWVMDWLFGWS